MVAEWLDGWRLIFLPRWAARLPFVCAFQPKITLRHDAALPAGQAAPIRWGTMPDGSEVSLGSTVFHPLFSAKHFYFEQLEKAGIRFVFPVVIEGTDFQPLPALARWDLGGAATTAARPGEPS